MGYRAYGYGAFTLVSADKKGECEEALKGIIASESIGCNIDFSETEDGKTVVSTEWPDVYNYHPEDVEAVLTKLKPFITEGSLEFGDGGSDFWQFKYLPEKGEFKEFKYLPEKGEFKEISGYILYGMEEIVDAYRGNRETLEKLPASERDDSYEQGYNNAMVFVLKTLGWNVMNQGEITPLEFE